MQHNRVFRITADDIEQLQARTDDQSLIAACERWIRRSCELDDIVRQIEEAFAGQSLGDGIGLLEANGIDDYATVAERAELRLRDERTDWRRIDSEMLNHCYTAPTYFDARGFVFHLPAFLIAELNDEFYYSFIDRLIDAAFHTVSWIELLTTAQRDVLVSALRLIADHPAYQDRLDDIELLIKQIRPDSGDPPSSPGHSPIRI